MQNPFNPREMSVLIEVVDEACLRLGNCDDSTRAVIAARILAHAGEGKRDFATLLSLALHGSAERRNVMRHRRVSPGNDNDKALHLMSMPARARAIALQCGSEQVAELLELHARLCERNLAASSRKGRRAGVRLVEAV